MSRGWMNGASCDESSAMDPDNEPGLRNERSNPAAGWDQEEGCIGAASSNRMKMSSSSDIAGLT